MKDNKEDKRPLLIIIDGSSVLYRAFHAVPSTFTSATGMPTNAIYGFTQTLWKILKDFRPEYIGVAFDVKGPSFRHELFVDYKAERKPMPDLLVPQIPYIKRIVRAFNIPALEMTSFEADDVIATLIKRFRGIGLKIALITGDKDMYQLVDGDTVILDYMTEKEYGPVEVEEKFGVRPELIRDLLALAGDTSDNIPGVPGIGFKTAAKLLNEFGSFEGIFSNVESISKDKLRENLKTYKDQAYLSRELAALHPDVPFECTLGNLKYDGPDLKELVPLLKDLDFKKILKEVTPAAEPKDAVQGDFRAVSEKGELDSVVGELKSAGRFSATVLMTEEGFTGKFIGIGLGVTAGKAYFMPSGDYFGDGLKDREIMDALKSVIEDEKIAKDTDNSKAAHILFGRSGIALKGVGIDTSIASYLINPSKSDHTIDGLAFEYLGIAAGKLEEPEVRIYTALACKKACNIIEIAGILSKKLEEENLNGLYAGLELPLTKVLAEMEISGIKVDKELLRSLSKEMETQLAVIEKAIYASAGMEFNINSPKQLSEVLFEKLKLKPLRKTKTGFSTDEEVLTQLAAKHEVPQHIINFRQLSKLKSTYVDALLEIASPETGRVHTSFNQTVTATGRLSSSRPNLQNIPIRGEAAGRIREAFVAEAGHIFLSADYSQIELRILAHISEDPVLIDSFKKDEDIHSRTASEVFGILPALVTPEMRRRAKAINFGIIYGMGPYGLSTELGISMKEATEYIERYFAHYGKVKEFIDRTIEEAGDRGYTVTLFGRRRFIPELKSPIDSTVRLGQRLAVNTTIQGTAADMIKAAMIRIPSLFVEKWLKSRMILQIHDELVFEVVEREKEDVSSLVRTEMEGVLPLRVPVKVNLKSGVNWRMVE